MDANVVTAIVMMSGTFVLGFLFYWVLSGLSKDKQKEVEPIHHTNNIEKKIAQMKLYQASLENDLQRHQTEIEKLQVERTYLDNLEAENISLKNLQDSIKLHNHQKGQSVSSSKSRKLKVERPKKKAQ